MQFALPLLRAVSVSGSVVPLLVVAALFVPTTAAQAQSRGAAPPLVGAAGDGPADAQIRGRATPPLESRIGADGGGAGDVQIRKQAATPVERPAHSGHSVTRGEMPVNQVQTQTPPAPPAQPGPSAPKGETLSNQGTTPRPPEQPTQSGHSATKANTHAHHVATPRPPEKPGGMARALRRFEYVAAEGEALVFPEPTVVRWEPRAGSFAGEMRERTFEAGERQICNAATFSAVGVGGGTFEYVCTRLVEAITMRELMPQTTGLPYVDPRLQMAARRGYTREVLGASLGPHQSRPGPGGEFRISCRVSHMGFEDPIVTPGREFWHHHTFLGNPGIDRHTTDPRDHPASVCAGGNINRSAYWFPSVIDTRFGMPIVPRGAIVYYKGSPDSLPSRNLRMITGDPMRTTPRDANIFPVSIWTCFKPDGSSLNQGLQDEIPAACPVGSRIIWTVSFPACWDGQHDDSANHKSHVWSRAYNKPGMALVANGCPATHPKRLFDLSINVHYVVNPGDDVSRWRLSSDAYEWSKPAGYSAHADWWNGWNMEFLAAVKRECHDKNRNCGTDKTPDTRSMNLK